LNKALDLNPGSSKTHYYVGLTYAKQREFDKAREFYLKVLEFKEDPHLQELAREKLSLLELGMANDLEYLDKAFQQILEHRRP
jgi:tetratricopeptide (TPR) repeat protein